MALPSFANRWDNRRVLITGGAGYLATNLVQLLGESTCRIVRLGRPGAQFAPVSGRAQVIDLTGDIGADALWEQALAGIDLVFHFAAQTSVYVAAANPLADLDANVAPIVRMLECCRRNGWAPSIVLAGTATEVGMPVRLPVGETEADRPITIYDLHKLMAEQYLKTYIRQGLVSGASLRLANVYGPGPRSSRADRGVLNMMIRKALQGEPLTVYGAGEPVRDYVYVEDVARAFLEAAAGIERVNGEHFVIGSGQGHTIAAAVNLVADRVALRTGRRVPVLHTEPPGPQSPIEARNFVADSGAFARATGWQAHVMLQEGIDRTIDAFQAKEISV